MQPDPHLKAHFKEWLKINLSFGNGSQEKLVFSP
jgi:hypothetical protein